MTFGFKHLQISQTQIGNSYHNNFKSRGNFCQTKGKSYFLWELIKLKMHCFNFSACTTNADIFFVLDSSGSVHYNNFNKMKDFVKSLVSNLNVFDDESNIGLITFR